MPSYLTGTVRLAVHGVRPEALFNRIRTTVPIGTFRKTASDACVITVDAAKTDAVRTQAKSLGGTVSVQSRRGFPELVRRLLHRPGLLAGLIAAISLVFFTRGLIWELRIEGTERIEKAELCRELRAVGICEGARQHKDRLDDAVLRTLVADGRIAWMSVNYDGTVARVMIDERDEAEKDTGLCDYITAARDGVLVRLDVLGGGAEAKNGDAVTRGQLLVSSFRPSREAGTLYDPARGFAWALTSRVYVVTVPKMTVRRVYASEETTRQTMLILGRRVCLTPFASEPPPPYARRTRTARVMLFERIPLPFRVKTVTRRPYTLEETPLYAEDARALAEASLARRIASFPDGTRVLSQTESFAESDDDYTFTYCLECLENIAEPHGNGKSAP